MIVLLFRIKMKTENGISTALMQQQTQAHIGLRNKYYENKNGVAILKEGQYRGSHKIGLHAR